LPKTSADRRGRAPKSLPAPSARTAQPPQGGALVDPGGGLPPARLLRFPYDFPGIDPMSGSMAHDMFTPARPVLTPELMIRAYAAGIFPMSDGAEARGIFWVDPQRRGVFPLDRFHISRSLRQRIARGGFEISVDRDFAGVVSACADRDETWINSDIFQTYLALHAMGHAHSVEVWMEGELAGGVFGITLGAAFFGESMFSRRTDGSKLALSHLVTRLRLGGFQLFDTQFTTSHLESMGAVEIPRSDYRRQLQIALGSLADFFAMDRQPDP
jgi:leucyl/phenylalanyl-tRNA--protein transferase